MNILSNRAQARRIVWRQFWTTLAFLAVVAIIMTALAGCSTTSGGVAYEDAQGNKKVYRSDPVGPKQSNKSLCTICGF